jgi:hypothetical protein
MPDDNERRSLIDIFGEAITESLPQHLQTPETAETVSWVIRAAVGFWVGYTLMLPFLPSEKDNK